jgi:hypothetical protein
VLLRSPSSLAFCSTEAESVLRSLPSFALHRRKQRALDLPEPKDTLSFGLAESLACGILESWSVVKSKAYPAHPLCLMSEVTLAASQGYSPLSP